MQAMGCKRLIADLGWGRTIWVGLRGATVEVSADNEGKRHRLEIDLPRRPPRSTPPHYRGSQIGQASADIVLGSVARGASHLRLHDLPEDGAKRSGEVRTSVVCKRLGRKRVHFGHSVVEINSGTSVSTGKVDSLPSRDNALEARRDLVST